MDNKQRDELDKKYIEGTHNHVMRYYYYLNKGLDILNQFRNLFLGIIAVYFTLHLTNPVWLGAMFLPALLLLTVAGYYSVHYLSKMQEWLNLRFSTHFGIRQFNYTEGSYELLKEIRDNIKQHGNPHGRKSSKVRPRAQRKSR